MEIAVATIVLKTALDQLIRSVESGIGQVSGPGIAKKSSFQKIGLKPFKLVKNQKIGQTGLGHSVGRFFF